MSLAPKVDEISEENISEHEQALEEKMSLCHVVLQAQFKGLKIKWMVLISDHSICTIHLCLHQFPHTCNSHASAMGMNQTFLNLPPFLTA